MNYSVLVNKKYPYKEENFQNRKLIEVKVVEDEKILLEEKTASAFFQLQEFLKNEKNLTLEICLGYVESDENEVREHGTGLCLDFILKEESNYEEVYPYLAEFGFILRYPKGKEESTGYSYEPGHIRYVGPSLATSLMEKNWTLEEYYQNLSAVLVVNKEAGISSRDVVNLVNRSFYTKKVGHTGTLDPMATGVLVITIGKATRIGELLTSSEKEYIAGVQLGISTDTLDTTGMILNEMSVPSNLEIEKVLKSFQKKYWQEVPIYSAVKVHGKKLYEYARENSKVDLPKREVEIQKIQLLEKKEDSFIFQVVVSKGTYIRSLIRDIGKNLGVFATMSSLVRTKQGIFRLNQASTLQEIKEGKARLLSLSEALKNYPVVFVDSIQEKKVKNGQSLKNTNQVVGTCVLKNETGEVIAIYRGTKEVLTPWKVLI